MRQFTDDQFNEWHQTLLNGKKLLLIKTLYTRLLCETWADTVIHILILLTSMLIWNFSPLKADILGAAFSNIQLVNPLHLLNRRLELSRVGS